MFNYFRNRKQRRDAEQLARIAEAGAAARNMLTAQIEAVATAAIADINSDVPVADEIMAKAEAIQRGVGLVLLDGHEAFGPTLANEDHPTQLGGMMAHGARNLMLLTGSPDSPDRVGDIRHGLGLSRE
jgi:hypothetical protein